MEKLFTALTHAVDSTPAIALAAAFVWGILSILLSPCHLASIPLIVGFVDQQGRMSTKRVLFYFDAVCRGDSGHNWGYRSDYGRGRSNAGRCRPIWKLFCRHYLFLVGLYLLDVIPMPWSGPGQVGMKRKGLLAALILGLVFGIAIGPCTFAYMAPMLGVTFKVVSTSLVYGIILLLAYGVGHCLVIVFAGTCTEVVQRYMNWNEKSKGAVILKKICGILVIMGGLYLIFVAW